MQVGIDEVGRGCWAGPLVAAAVMLRGGSTIAGLNDSKKLSRVQREKLDVLVRAQSVAYGIGWVWPAEIDEYGLTKSVSLAMERALLATVQSGASYDEIVIDGNYNFLPQYQHVRTLVQGDSLVPSISAASIIAKVARDDHMRSVAAKAFPEYGFDKHVGYGTAHHIVALQAHGVTAIHRRSFKPIQAMLQTGVVQSEA